MNDNKTRFTKKELKEALQWRLKHQNIKHDPLPVFRCDYFRKLNIQTKKEGEKMNEYICKNCGTVGKLKKHVKGSLIIEGFLWIIGLLGITILPLIIIIPLIYSVWRGCSSTRGCIKCLSKEMIQIDSPIGAKLVKDLGK